MVTPLLTSCHAGGANNQKNPRRVPNTSIIAQSFFIADTTDKNSRGDDLNHLAFYRREYREDCPGSFASLPPTYAHPAFAMDYSRAFAVPARGEMESVLSPDYCRRNIERLHE